MNPIGKGFMVATAVAALVVGGDLAAQTQSKAGGDAVKCAGINDCKGKGGCKSALVGPELAPAQAGSLLLRWIEDGTLADLGPDDGAAE